MVFNVFSRPENVPVQLSHYSQSPAVADFVVIWAGPEPVLELSSQVSKPVHVIVPPDSSLNWRFYPWPEISRSCVIPMDDGAPPRDLSLPHADTLSSAAHC